MGTAGLAFIVAGLLVLSCPLAAFSQNDKKALPKKKIEDASLHVVSDKMVAKRESSNVEFIGNVKATRIDSVIQADSLQVFFNESGSQTDADSPQDPNQGNVKKIVAAGNVRYTAGERKAFADKAVYTAQNQVLVLTGKTAKLMTGTSFVTGKKITLYRAEDKVVVESDGSNRVEALFNPEDNVKDKADNQ